MGLPVCGVQSGQLTLSRKDIFTNPGFLLLQRELISGWNVSCFPHQLKTSFGPVRFRQPAHRRACSGQRGHRLPGPGKRVVCDPLTALST